MVGGLDKDNQGTSHLLSCWLQAARLVQEPHQASPILDLRGSELETLLLLWEWRSQQHMTTMGHPHPVDAVWGLIGWWR